MLKTGFVGAVVVLGMAFGAEAQVPSTAADAGQLQARQRIFLMEGVLERAVQVGVDSLRRELGAAMSDDMLLVAGGGPQARGFPLEGYGILFDVEVPAVRPSLAWSLRTMNETAAMFTRDLAQMRERIRQAVTDEPMRTELERVLLRIQQQAVPMAGRTQAPVAVADDPSRTEEPGPSIDPGEAYTEAVKVALVDAMVENSGSLMIGADEWLTVAARDNSQNSRFVASDPSVAGTIMMSVKGSDLAAFRVGRLDADEIRRRVEIREF